MSKLFDRAADVLTTENIGLTRSLTPEGFLLCSGVRIARTGPMMYLPEEIPDIDPGSNRMIVIERDADVLFDPDCLASFQGKPVTNDHPDDMVSPQTWRETCVGVVLNPRRGDGIEDHYLIADLLITDAAAIADIEANKREVSCGYDSDRVQVRPGLGRTTKVVGNHVALVERGRCGPSCAIQDKEPNPMAKRSVWDRMRTAFKAKDEAAFEEELQNAMEASDESGDPAQPVVVHIHNAPADKGEAEAAEPAKDEGEVTDPLAIIMERLDKIEARIGAVEGAGNDADPDREEKKPDDETDVTDEDAEEEEKKNDEEEKAAPVKDSVNLRDEFVDVLARAEILAPGIKLPVFDGKAKRKMTVDAMCTLRVKALETAFGDATRKVHVVAVLGAKPNFTKMTCDAASLAFRAASELARVANNKDVKDAGKPATSGPMTAAKLQALNEARRQGKA